MKKLSIEDLQVDSFATAGEPGQRGTVQAYDTVTAFEDTCAPGCESGPTERVPTCENQYTCPNTCPATCLQTECGCPTKSCNTAAYCPCNPSEVCAW